MSHRRLPEDLRRRVRHNRCRILYRDGLLDKMFFICEDGETSLSEGGICEEDLLTWCRESSSVSKDGRKIRADMNRRRSTRTVTCLTNMEAFARKAEDSEEATGICARYPRNPHVQGAIR
ncbi:hypothetical protein MLD38_028267 [Melastoma candidum]|uniref:Uncharacterized protein n=1 Tax=Melastoma candidum TaxID=119954 RepID=A0ACB9N2A3_9MYRT|nr:hypothetical protein MLD38_028267 [Melastoma candidum]